MKVRFKKLSDKAITPSYSKLGDAGMDLTAITKSFDGANDVYGTGLAIEIPEGFVGLIFPRSSNSKTDQYLTNHVGVIDSNYRGEIMFKYRNIVSYISRDLQPSFKQLGEHEVGDRVGQLIIIPYPEVELEEVDELSDSNRGNDGFGSTGK